MLRGSNISRALQVLRADPPLLFAAAKGKLRRLLPLPSSPHIGSVGGVRFEFDFSLGPTVSMMYRRTYQPDIQHAVHQMLSRGGIFVDVGASIGFVSALALDVVGQDGFVLAIEPVPAYLDRLQRLADLNPRMPLRIVGAAASDEDGEFPIELNRAGNIGMNSLVPGFIPDGEVGDRVLVPLVDLGQLLVDEGLSPDLVKIDVEGYEPKVLRSLLAFTKRTGHRPAVLCEVTPVAWIAQRESLDELEEGWSKAGYELRNPLTLQPLRMVDRHHQTDLLLTPR